MSDVSIAIVDEPLPLPKARNTPVKVQFPLDQLDVGQTFVLRVNPDGMSEKDAMRLWRARLATAVARCTKATGKRFAIRKLDTTTLGCWRVE